MTIGRIDGELQIVFAPFGAWKGDTVKIVKVPIRSRPFVGAFRIAAHG